MSKYQPEHEAPSVISEQMYPGAREDSVLKDAYHTVNSDRQDEYGDPVENAIRAAIVATATTGKPVTPLDIVQMMSAYKMVRSGRGHKRDTNIDQAGYAEIRDRVQRAMKDGTVQKIVEQLLSGWVQFNTKPSVDVLFEGRVSRISNDGPQAVIGIHVTAFGSRPMLSDQVLVCKR